MNEQRPTMSLTIAGELTIYVAAEREAAIRDAVGSGASGINLDLQDVTEIDTAGLQLLFLLTTLAEREGISTTLHDPSPAVADLLRVAGLGLDLEPLCPAGAADGTDVRPAWSVDERTDEG